MSTTSLLVIIAPHIGNAWLFLGKQTGCFCRTGRAITVTCIPCLSITVQTQELFTAIPALAILSIWLLTQPMLLERYVQATIPESLVEEGSSTKAGHERRAPSCIWHLYRAYVNSGMSSNTETLTLNADIRDLLAGLGAAVGSDVQSEVLSAAQKYRCQDWSILCCLSALPSRRFVREIL